MKSIFIIIIDYNELFTYYTVLNGIVMLLFIGILFVGQWSTDESKNKMVYNGLGQCSTSSGSLMGYQ